MQSDLFGNVPEIVIDIHETGGKGKNSVKHLMSMLDKEQITYSIQKIISLIKPSDNQVLKKLAALSGVSSSFIHCVRAAHNSENSACFATIHNAVASSSCKERYRVLVPCRQIR